MVPISKCVPEDDGYHVPGALIVAPERAMQYATSQLRRAIAECGDFPVFVITPWARYTSQPCCIHTGHVSNFQDPDFLPDLLRDLNKQKFELRKSLAPATVLDGIQLVCGENSSMEKKVQTMRAGWASDPVHPNTHIYAKMALNLIEKIAVASGPQAAVTGGRKRSWSSSNRDEQTQGSSSNLRRGERFGGAGGTGGGSGGRDSRRNDSYDGGNRGSGGNKGRTTSRSSDWKMRGASSAYGQPGRGGRSTTAAAAVTVMAEAAATVVASAAQGAISAAAAEEAVARAASAPAGVDTATKRVKKPGRTSNTAAQFFIHIDGNSYSFLVIS
jgi:hypothetical protein